MLLLDASVWLAARDVDDRDHVAARDLVEGAASGSLGVAALDLTLYEVANVAAVRWRSAAEAERLVRLVVRSCPDTLERVDEKLLEAAGATAVERRLTVYDAAYIAASERRGWVLVSGDRTDLVDPGFALTPADARHRDT